MMRGDQGKEGMRENKFLQELMETEVPTSEVSCPRSYPEPELYRLQRLFSSSLYKEIPLWEFSFH